MSQDADQGDEDLDLSALEAAVANLGLDDDSDEPASAAPPNPGLDLTEAPEPAGDEGETDNGVSVFDAPGLPDDVEIPDFSGASMVGAAAEAPDPDPFDDDDAGSSSGALPPPQSTSEETAASALRDLGQDDGDTDSGDEADADMPSLPAPDPVPAAVEADVMIETFTAQGGKIRGPLKAVKGLFGR